MRVGWFVFLMFCGSQDSQDSQAIYQYPLPSTAYRMIPPVLFKVEKETSLFLPLIMTSQDSWEERL